MRRSSPLAKLGKGVAVTALLAFTLFPVYFMLSTAFNERAGSGTDSLLPKHWTFEHFTHAMGDGHFGTYMVNSAIVTVATVVISCALALLGAVAMARFQFKLRTTMLVMILIVQMVPAEALVIPLFLQMKDLRMLNSLAGLSLVYIAFSLPFAIWNLRGFVAAVPVELEEAAYLDGCSWWQMFRRVLFPLVIPGLIATSAFSFVMAWEEFLFAVTFLNSDARMTVGAGLRQYFGQNVNDWGGLMAASTLVTIPVVVIFVLAQRRLGAGLVSGAVK
ncbi:carbohydrate ABC transporter permease [Luteipulveratus mongoliensis]|uniref:Sugar ABC transporter permease n=1 Tax=Luteipulveratus mongoliensis TaxID=571913 RepID=A0A0K1JIW2_9MICO|nr:carbohydrate ABC transporter permease [Luteipulveratus mongoliensis]AKU16523.1 sugar ABC transporter permease [Luteipulveratus mongoliensis]